MSSEDFVISDDLNQHILWILAQLEPRSAEVRELVASGVDGDIFCYALGTAQPAVPEATIARASALGLTVDIDFYESPDEEDE